VTVGVSDVLTGADAWGLLKRTNQFNSPPGEGNEYVLAKFYASVAGEADNEVFNTWDASVWSLVANGRAFDGSRTNLGLVMPKPEFEGEIVPPGEIEGWTAFEIPAGAEKAAVLLRQGQAQKGGFWFSLDKE
jgi:hypothetical protein